MKIKKYFENFDWIEQANGARSLSFFTKVENGIFSQEVYKEFQEILASDEDRFRISLHTSSEDKLHNMIIGMKQDSFVYPHKHDKSESYHIMQGKVLLIYFTDDSKVNKSIILSPQESLIARIDENTFHALIALEDSIFHETRLGPFISEGDSIFASWHENEPIKYMQNLKKSIQG